MNVTLNCAPERWILRRPGQQAALRLFCFCYAGGNAAVYLPWQTALGQQIEVCAVQLPGRGARFSEPLLQDIDSVVPAIIQAMTPLLDRPFAFFGHSLGALLAYETTHHLQERGAPMPHHLVVSGAQGPRLRTPKRQLHLLDDAELICELKRYAGTPDEVLESPELLALILPILRADFHMAFKYTGRERPPLPVPITVFAGRDDEFDSKAQYEDWFNDTSLQGELHWFDGGHFFINSAKDLVLERLSTLLKPSLRQALFYRHG